MQETAHSRRSVRRTGLVAALTMVALVVACSIHGPAGGSLHRWWSGFGPVLPHDTFPTDCKLCHVGETWNELTDNFSFDHAAQTGFPLGGAHRRAACLHCHNDRGPVAVFQAKGCAGCHEDVHYGELGSGCTSCHVETSWYPVGQVERHDMSRFPLVGAHRATACHRCHPGAFTGNFMPTDNDCLGCHRDDLRRAINPPHIGLGWVDSCERCHVPTSWSHARIR